MMYSSNSLARQHDNKRLPPYGGGLGRGLFSFLHKEFLHIFRDKVTMLILLVMPVVLIALFGFAITTEVKNSKIVVVDQIKNHLSSQIITALDENRYCIVTDIRSDSRGADELMQEGKADAILILDKNRGIQILADGSEPNQAQTRVGYIQQIIAPLLLPPLGGVSVVTATVSGNQTNITSSPEGGGQVGARMLFNPQLKSEYNFVPGVIGMIIMLICALMTSVSIVREKEMGTMEILLASPLHPLVIIISKLVPYFIVSSFNLVTILLLSRYVLGVPVAGSVAVFFLVSMVYVFVALALGLLISTAVNTQLAAMLLSLLLIVPTMYLSGMVFPLESMPKPLQIVSNIIPARWYMDAVRRILIQGVEFRYVLKDLAILCFEAVVLIGISLSLFKTRLE